MFWIYTITAYGYELWPSQVPAFFGCFWEFFSVGSVLRILRQKSDLSKMAKNGPEFKCPNLPYIEMTATLFGSDILSIIQLRQPLLLRPVSFLLLINLRLLLLGRLFLCSASFSLFLFRFFLYNLLCIQIHREVKLRTGRPSRLLMAYGLLGQKNRLSRDFVSLEWFRVVGGKKAFDFGLASKFKEFQLSLEAVGA